MASKKTIERNDKINAEFARLSEIYAKLPASVMKIVDSLIKNAAFMTVTLDELKDKMNKSGTVSKYKNGENQFGWKKSPEVDIYNTMIKNHSAIIKQLTELIPDDDMKPPHEPDAFEKIAGRGRFG